MNPLALIGNTPLVELTHCSPGKGVRSFAKLEEQNPTGSVKDRIVSYLVAKARALGRLRPHQEIVEATTGNTGIALAMLGTRLGHPVRVVVPETMFPAVDAARQIADRDDAFFLNHFGSSDPRCH